MTRMWRTGNGDSQSSVISLNVRACPHKAFTALSCKCKLASSRKRSCCRRQLPHHGLRGHAIRFWPKRTSLLFVRRLWCRQLSEAWGCHSVPGVRIPHSVQEAHKENCTV